MEAEQAQNKGGLDALAARLDARYKLEVKARENLSGEDLYLALRRLDTAESERDRAEQDAAFDKWFREKEFRRLARIGEFRNYKSTSSGEGVKTVLLFLLAAGMLALAADISFLDALIGLPLLIIGGVLGTFLAMLLFGEAGLIAFALFALLALFA